MSSIQEYFEQAWKVGKHGVAGNLADKVIIKREKSTLVICSHEAVAKRYVRYVAKRFLNKVEAADFCRVNATSKNGFVIRSFDMSEMEE